MIAKDLLRGLKVGIIGGSIGGLSSSILLSRLGADITVFERSPRLHDGKGVGVVLPRTLKEDCVELDLFDAEIPNHLIASRSFNVKDIVSASTGRPLWEQPFSVMSFNWSDLYTNLRKRISAQKMLTDEEVSQIIQQNDQYQVVTTKGERYQFDLLIAADGGYSVVRKQIFPNVAPNYAGYVAWRGSIDPSQLEHLKLNLKPMEYFVYQNGHFLIYFMPAADKENPQKLKLNWLLYEKYEESAVSSLLTDENNKKYAVSLPPGCLTKQHINHLHDFAKQVLPSEIAKIVELTEKPFLQAIYDFQVPQQAVGKICFVGDAAAVLRPHSASGVLKAISDSLSLAQAFETKEAEDLESFLQEWNTQQMTTTTQQVTLAKKMGDALVSNTPHWQEMNSESMENWWNELMSGQNWYATPEKKEEKEKPVIGLGVHQKKDRVDQPDAPFEEITLKNERPKREKRFKGKYT
ncbi:MAG: FAD-dependent monooxygenase [Candidatus Berkiellales bacterium]